MTVQGDVHEVTAYRCWCPVGCNWLEELFQTFNLAEKALRNHLLGYHNIAKEIVVVKMIKSEK